MTTSRRGGGLYNRCREFSHGKGNTGSHHAGDQDSGPGRAAATLRDAECTAISSGMSVTKRRAVRTIYFGRTLGRQLSCHFRTQRHMHTALFRAFAVGIHTRKRRRHSCPFICAPLHHMLNHLDKAGSHNHIVARYGLVEYQRSPGVLTCLFKLR